MFFEDLDMNNNTFIPADTNEFQYMGRIDFLDEKAPLFIYAGSLVKTRFTGTKVSIVIKNLNAYYDNYIGYIIDGNTEGKVKVNKHNEKIVLSLAEGLKDGVHELTIFKRQDGCHYFNFYGLVLDKDSKVLKVEEIPKRRIECYGDSISAGELSEALDYVGKKDPEKQNGEYSNSWYSYSMITARNLKAELNNNVQGGLAVMDGTGYFMEEGYVGLESTYDKLKYNPQLGKITKWDFKRYTPHVVIMALGQNDDHPDNYINRDMEKRQLWKEKYKDIIKSLRYKYPKALFVIITTLLNHDKGWDDALDEIQRELEDKKVVRCKFKRNGCATPGHLRIPEAYEMATELTEFIESFGEDVWK